MTTFISIFLLLYFILYFGITFLASTIIVSKKIGKNALVLPNDDSAYGLIAKYFKYILIGLFSYVLANFLWPELGIFKSMYFFEHNYFKIAGIVLLLISFIWTVLSQIQMNQSWRIGIDTDLKTKLVTTGIFRFSRNPIFVGMLLSLIGVFLCSANVFTIVFLIAGSMLIQIQIRLEEEHLLKEHAEEYINYKNKVRRFI